MEAIVDIRHPSPISPASATPDELGALEDLLAAGGAAEAPLELRRWLDQAEAWYITRTLRAVRGNRSEAARVLGIGRRTLYAKMQKLGIEASWRPTPSRC